MAVNSYLMSLARQQFEKSAVVPPGGDPSMGGAAPPVDPSMMGAVPPVDPATAAMGAAPPAGPAPSDPASAMAAMGGMAPPAPMPQATPTGGAPGQQKLKPEQMMQMLDYRLYNMQQQLTAIMNAMGVQVAPESLVLPPGTTGAPPAETALPGGPMAPPPQAAPADPAAAGAAPADPAAAAPPDMAKGAAWSADYLIDLHTKAAATAALRRSLTAYAR